jgi:L-glyceraldehyde 3-phosphate reductase
LAQGILTNKYLHGIPEDSRAGKSTGFLQKDQVTSETISKVKALHAIAEKRGQSLAQMAIAWLLKDQRVTTVLIGASRVEQLLDSLKAVDNKHFDASELEAIEGILG